MGHLSVIRWARQHPELHVEDVAREYQKAEPFISLDPSEALFRENVMAEFVPRLEAREKEIRKYASVKGNELSGSGG